LKIYSYPNNPNANKALIVAKYYDLEVETTPNFRMGIDNETTEFKKLNPNGTVPVLETSEGAIYETAAIVRYLGRLSKGNLYGKTVFENGLVDQWIDWCQWNIDLPAMAWLYPIKGFVPDNLNRTKKAKTDVRKALLLLNEHLTERNYLVGEEITIADIFVVCSLYPLYECVLDPGFRSVFLNTNKWFLHCINQPNFSEIIGNIELAKKMSVAKVKKKKLLKRKEVF
jgi:elongation factor 1-gamma